MKQTTIVFCLRDGKVLLGMKKAGFGVGKWNGFGGKVKEGETFSLTAVRELEEESGLTTTVADLESVARIEFFFADTPMFDCTVYTTRRFTGEPVETEEMRPQWFSVDSLPFADMWSVDTQWIPLILSGKHIKARVVYDDKGAVVRDFSYTEI